MLHLKMKEEEPLRTESKNKGCLTLKTTFVTIGYYYLDKVKSLVSSSSTRFPVLAAS